MITTVKDFGVFLNDQLKANDGNIDSISTSDFTENYRAIFNTGENTTGLKILINDTEKLVVRSFGDFSVDSSNNEWEGTFYFQVFDNFGLDDQDLIDFQGTRIFNLGPKFTCWWILQHIRSYKPFRTEIRNVFKIKGDLDDRLTMREITICTYLVFCLFLFSECNDFGNVKFWKYQEESVMRLEGVNVDFDELVILIDLNTT